MKRYLFAVALLLWLIAVSGGMYAVTRFEFRAGAKQSAPEFWPSDSLLIFNDHSYNLVLSLHPKCSCSNATLDELEKILTASGNRVKVHALLSLPPDAPSDWRQSALLERLKKLPRTEIVIDNNAEQARQFGAETSGDTVLYSPHKKRLFRGGITQSRGHSGDNAGEESILAIINGNKNLRDETPVFGCSLNGSTQKEARP